MRDASFKLFLVSLSQAALAPLLLSRVLDHLIVPSFALYCTLSMSCAFCLLAYIRYVEEECGRCEGSIELSLDVCYEVTVDSNGVCIRADHAASPSASAGRGRHVTYGTAGQTTAPCCEERGSRDDRLNTGNRRN